MFKQILFEILFFLFNIIIYYNNFKIEFIIYYK